MFLLVFKKLEIVLKRLRRVAFVGCDVAEASLGLLFFVILSSFQNIEFDEWFAVWFCEMLLFLFEEKMFLYVRVIE